MATLGDTRAVLDGQMADALQASDLAGIDRMVDRLEELFRGAEDDRARELRYDDEALNWCAAEVGPHLRSALWSTAVGFYPSALASAERALHLGTAALAYFIRDSRLDVEGEVILTPTFSEWESGAGLPTVDDMRAWLTSRSAQRPALSEGVLPPSEALDALTKALRTPQLHHHLQRGYPAPGFHGTGHEVATTALRDVIGVLAAMWLLELPHTRRGNGLETLLGRPWPAALWRELTC